MLNGLHVIISSKTIAIIWELYIIKEVIDFILHILSVIFGDGNVAVNLTPNQKHLPFKLYAQDLLVLLT